MFDLDMKYGDVIGATGHLFDGTYNMTQLLNAQQILQHPFLAAPGEQYCYVNANFDIAGYVVEKVRASCKCQDGVLLSSPCKGM